MNKTKPNPQDAGFHLKIQSCLLSLGKTLKSIYVLSGGFVSLKQKGLLKTRVTTPRWGPAKIGILQNKQ